MYNKDFNDYTARITTETIGQMKGVFERTIFEIEQNFLSIGDVILSERLGQAP